MRVEYPTIAEPARPEFILEVLRDQHRQQCEFDPEAEPTDLSFDSSVDDWRDACDLVAWRDLGRALNEFWGVTIPDSAWCRALEPSSSRSLRGVCELLAQHAQQRIVRPARLLGSHCDTAGAFLTVRSLLREAGAASDDIRPSTPLEAYTRRFPDVFLNSVSQLAPGALPLVRIHSPIHDLAMWACLAGPIVAAIGVWLGGTATAIVGGAVFALGYVLTWITARFIGPASVEFGDLRTFGDLARAMSCGSPSNPRVQTDRASPRRSTPGGRRERENR